MFTVEYSATHLARRGRIVTDTGYLKTPNLGSAWRAGDKVWQRIGRRRGTTLEVRITDLEGNSTTRRYRRD